MKMGHPYGCLEPDERRIDLVKLHLTMERIYTTRDII